VRLTYLRLHYENQSARLVFGSNAKGSLRVDLSTRFAIVEPVVGLIGRPPRRSTIVGPYMRSRGVNLGPTGRPWARGREAAPKLVCATPYKAPCNPINQLSRDPNLGPTTYTITSIKT
jgi:hypothetical protein